MKKINYLMISVLLVFSCSKDNGSTNEDFVSIPEAINFFSEDFIESTYSVFVRGDEEIKMDISTVYQIRDHKVWGETVKVEHREILLNYGEPNSIYNIFLEATPLFRYETKAVEPLITVTSMVGNSLGGMFISYDILTLQDDDPNIHIYNTKALGSKSFTDVVGFEFDDRTSFANLYITKNDGVVAFSDENNELWVLDRLE